MTDAKKVEEVVAEEPKEEVKNEMKSFIDEYGELVKKYGFDFASYPVWVPDGQGGFKTIVQTATVNMKDLPQKSPFVAE